MVLEIRLSNFFSIGEEVCLDLRAANMRSKLATDLENNSTTFNKDRILQTAAIYGANASGKSNLIKAIRFCHFMVLESHNHNEGVEFNFKPFKFDNFNKKTSSYFIRFVHQNIEYEYSFTLTRNEILKESLFHYPNLKRAKIFERDERKGKDKRTKYSFTSGLIKKPFDVAESTSNKTLFISRASQMDRDIPKSIYSYFNSTFILSYLQHSVKNAEVLIQKYKPQLLDALQIADSDIVDFKPKIRKEKGKNIKANPVTEEVQFEELETDLLEIKTYHKSSPSTAFDFSTEESLGTRKLFYIMLTILDVVVNDKVLLIDEIEDSLHPQILDYILDIFHSSKKSQLIFSTHNTHLLDLKKMRKDQIWFVNKMDTGSSELYSLYDFNDFRDGMNLEKAYLQGRFNAVPIVTSSRNRIQHMIYDE